MIEWLSDADVVEPIARVEAPLIDAAGRFLKIFFSILSIILAYLYELIFKKYDFVRWYLVSYLYHLIFPLFTDFSII